MISVSQPPPRGLITGLVIVNVSLVGNYYDCPEIVSACHATSTSPSLLLFSVGCMGAWGRRFHVWG